MLVRAAKVLLVLLVGLFSLLVGADNVVDYGTNYAFVQHVMSMDTIFPNSTLTWCAITSPVLHHAAYALIIAAELLTGILCLGFFVTPALLGSRRDVMLANLVDFYTRQTFDWALASGAAVVLLALSGLFIAVLARAPGARQLVTGDR